MATPNKRYNNKNRSARSRKNDYMDYKQLFVKLSKNGVIVDGKINNNLKQRFVGYTTEQVQTYLANPSRYEKDL